MGAVVLLSAAAPEDVAKAKQVFSAGQKLYKLKQYAEAIEKFEEAYRLKPHAVITFNLARCYEALGDVPKALRSYRAYLAAQPDATDKELVAQTISRLEDRSKSATVVLVNTAPSGAAVTIDGRNHGLSPATIELPAGSHTVTVAKAGFESIERAFVMADKSVELSFPLKALATLVPTAQPIRPAAVAPLTAAAVAPLRGKAWVPAVAGGALLVGGGIFYGLAKGAEGQLRRGDPSVDPDALVVRGQLQQTIGFAMGGVGLAALAVGTTMFLWPAKSGGPRLTVLAGPGAGAAVLSGELP